VIAGGYGAAAPALPPADVFSCCTTSGRLQEKVMPLFRKRDRRPAATTHDRAYTPRRLTPDDARNVAFSKPPIGKRGYNEDEVDAFLGLVEAVLAGVPGNSLSAAEVRNVAFFKPRIGKRGYDEDDVDTFLDLVEQELKHRATGKGA
jgi:DivIVA domain-containing protein